MLEVEGLNVDWKRTYSEGLFRFLRVILVSFGSETTFSLVKSSSGLSSRWLLRISPVICFRELFGCLWVSFEINPILLACFLRKDFLKWWPYVARWRGVTNSFMFSSGPWGGAGWPLSTASSASGLPQAQGWKCMDRWCHVAISPFHKVLSPDC